MLIDNLVTRLPNGITNVDAGDIFNSLKFPSHLGYHVFDEDFYTYTAAQWTETDVQGTNAVTVADGEGGLITMTTGATTADEVQIQRVASGVTAQSWLLDPNKKFFMDILVSVDVLTVTAFLGLCITDTTIIAGATDSLAFRIATGGVVTLVTEKDSTESSVSVGTLTAATQARLSAFYDGQGSAGRLYAAFDGTAVGYVAVGSNYNDNEAMTVSAAVRTLTDAAKVVTIDRIFIAQER